MLDSATLSVDFAGPIEPSDTYCWDGVITVSIFLMPAIIAILSAELIDPVRSATTATSIGLGGLAPQVPLHAVEITCPVVPLSKPRTGANANGTSAASATLMVLHLSFCGAAGKHGIAQIESSHRRPG